MALSMGLPIKIKISYVAEINNGGSPAKIFIPADLPLYSSPDMINYSVKMQICKTSIKTPSSLLGILAHELAHIVLYSKRHIKKDDEHYTDLVAMLMGYAKIMKFGRKVKKSTVSISDKNNVTTTTTHTNTITYGYLSDKNFDFAFKMIESYLKKQIFTKTILMQKNLEYKNNLNKTDKLHDLVKYFLNCLSKKTRKKVNPIDAQKLVIYYTPSYFDTYISTREAGYKLAANIIKYCNAIKIYTAKDIENIHKYSKQLDNANQALLGQDNQLRTMLSVIKKYVSFIYRFRVA
jgi:hypothetical protein